MDQNSQNNGLIKNLKNRLAYFNLNAILSSLDSLL